MNSGVVNEDAVRAIGSLRIVNRQSANLIHVDWRSAVRVMGISFVFALEGCYSSICDSCWRSFSLARRESVAVT
jgi:hypothetical protein